MKKALLVFVLYSLLLTPASAQTDQRPAPFKDIGAHINEGLPPVLQINRPASEIMFDRQNHVTDKAKQQLLMRQDGTYEDGKFIIGGRFIGSFMYERTNTDGKFPILSRLPPSHTRGSEDFFSVVNDASINGTITLPYITLFAQGEYTDIAYRGQESTQWRKYWVTLGDLDVLPIYLTAGKKTLSFGDFSSYAPITHNHSSHYFWAQNGDNDDPMFELGYIKDNLHATATLIKNGRGLRVINAPKGEDGYENFALNISNKWQVFDNHSLKLGAGYLRGTIYDSTLAHHPPVTGLSDRDWSPAWNVNAVYSTGTIDLMAEFTRTVDKWPATDAHVHALTLQGRYFDYWGAFPVIYSLMYSEGVQGNSGDEWEKMNQTVAGLEVKIHPHVSLGFEYINSIDFVPLIMPQITADDGVVSHTLIAGMKFTF